MEPRTDVDPDEVVAMGAAIHAASLLDQGGDAFLLDVTPLSLQIGVAGGLTEPVIERNTPVPIEQTRTFTTFNDFQQSVSIRVYQGESREASENELLGQFEFGGFRSGRRGEVEIDVTFEINTDGIVNVTARDRANGEAASTRITLASGLSETEINSIIGRGVADRVETAKPADVAGPPAARGPASNAGDELVAVPASARATAPRSRPADVITTAVDDLVPASETSADRGDLADAIDELDLADIEGLDDEILGEAEPESLFEEPGTDLADDELS
jgi:molecular chaperone DnaK (HSP70)